MHEPQIDLIHFEGCPNADRARANLREALGGEEGWREWDLTSEAIPDRYRGHGSPTVLVDGHDVTGRAAEVDATACRADGAPSVEAIHAALESAAGGE